MGSYFNILGRFIWAVWMVVSSLAIVVYHEIRGR